MGRLPNWIKAGLIWMSGAAIVLPATAAPGAASVGMAQQIGTLPIRHLLAPRPAARAQSGESASARRSGAIPLQEFSVRITAPSHDEIVGGKIEISARVQADRPEQVLFVEFEVDGRVLFADADVPYELIWQGRDPAAHRIVARAYAASGQVVEDVIRTRPPPGLAAGLSFRSRVDWVEVFVRVEDKHLRGRELKMADFSVFENGLEQPIVAVERSMNLPLAVGFMVDCSGSMIESLSLVLETAGSFIEGLMQSNHDKAFVMSFADLPSMLQEFTNDIGRLSDALDLISSGRYTRLYDSLVKAAAEFRGHEGRRALVVLTDGHDVGSDSRLRDAIEAAQRADVAIYPVAVNLSLRFVHERWVLAQLAEGTGGRVSQLQRRDDPRRIFDAITADLREQYRITYQPHISGGTGEWRAIEVQLSLQGSRRKKRLRARPGYFAE